MSHRARAHGRVTLPFRGALALACTWRVDGTCALVPAARRLAHDRERMHAAPARAGEGRSFCARSARRHRAHVEARARSGEPTASDAPLRARKYASHGAEEEAMVAACRQRRHVSERDGGGRIVALRVHRGAQHSSRCATQSARARTAASRECAREARWRGRGGATRASVRARKKRIMDVAAAETCSSKQQNGCACASKRTIFLHGANGAIAAAMSECSASNAVARRGQIYEAAFTAQPIMMLVLASVEKPSTSYAGTFLRARILKGYAILSSTSRSSVLAQTPRYVQRKKPRAMRACFPCDEDASRWPDGLGGSFLGPETTFC